MNDRDTLEEIEEIIRKVDEGSIKDWDCIERIMRVMVEWRNIVIKDALDEEGVINGK